MAPSHAVDFHHPRHLHLFARAQDPNNPPLVSVFALVIDRARALATRSISAVTKSIASRNVQKAAAPIGKLSIVKRQSQILVIPTTYAHLNDSPAPGAVVGITLGAIIGFLLIFFLMLFIFRNTVGGGATVVEEEIIRRHNRSSRSKRSQTASSMSEGPAPPEPVVVESRRSSRRESRTSRRTSRPQPRPEPDEVIVEEELSAEGAEEAVVVEEEEDDIVEVIEEHSPEPPPRRRKSGYRTVDPAEHGGGRAPRRRVSRNS